MSPPPGAVRVVDSRRLSCPLVPSLKGKHTNGLSLRFVDPDLETRYSVEKEKQSGAAFCCSCVVLLFTTLMEALIDHWSARHAAPSPSGGPLVRPCPPDVGLSLSPCPGWLPTTSPSPWVRCCCSS